MGNLQEISEKSALEAAIRLRSWIHNYGGEKQPVFIEDLETVLQRLEELEAQSARLEAENERLVQLVEQSAVKRMFPLMPESRRNELPGPLKIPWVIAEKAYGVYASRYGRSQSLERLAERGGFYVSEMDALYPPWRSEVDRIAELEAANASQSESLSNLMRQMAEVQVENQRLREGGVDT